jgi:hypothetical protein
MGLRAQGAGRVHGFALTRLDAAKVEHVVAHKAVERPGAVLDLELGAVGLRSAWESSLMNQGEEEGVKKRCKRKRKRGST